MITGNFESSHWTGQGSSLERHIEVVYEITNHEETNTSTMSWKAYIRSTASSKTSWVYAKQIKVNINGITTTLVGDTAKKTIKDDLLGSGIQTFQHESDGTCSIQVSVSGRFYTYGSDNSSYTGTLVLPPNPTFTLSVETNEGTNVSIVRTYSASGNTGALTDGAGICGGDIIKITYSADENYNITTATANGSNFTSGANFTVTGNLSIEVLSTPTMSSVSATNANIGSVSIITVTKHNPNYTHRVWYEFGELYGELISKSNPITSLNWTVPISFYDEMPNQKYGSCLIGIETFDGNTSIGYDSTTIIITAPEYSSIPDLLVSVTDENSAVATLVGDSGTIIRYMSDVLCSITAEPKNSATISVVKINGNIIPRSQWTETEDGIVSVDVLFSNTDINSYLIEVVDSRGYSNIQFVEFDIIDYIQPSINPSIVWSGNGINNELLMGFTGNCFRYNFPNGFQNSVTIKYRYKKSTDAAFNNTWYQIPANKILYGTNSYRSTENIIIQGTFDYRDRYIFEIVVSDGDQSFPLGSATKTVQINAAIPVFDWGRDDFNFNVDVKLKGEDLISVILDNTYPVGSIYLSLTGSMPDVINSIGEWERVVLSGIDSVYAWERTE